MKQIQFKSRPKVTSIDIEPYLKRLAVYQELPSINYLRQLHRYHLRIFPFENLDVHFRHLIALDVQKIYDKLIYSKRGGFCYELNLLFYHLLIHVGYEAHLISARVRNEENKKHEDEYDHMAILVKIQEDIFLCDVGFGNSFLYPKKLEWNSLQMDYDQYFKFTTDPDDNIILSRSDDGSDFKELYQFQPKLREPIEFIDRCNYHQTDPNSRFVGQKIITKLTTYGRVHLTDSLLRIVEKGETTTEEVLNEDAFYAKMEEHFGIKYQSLLHQ